LISGTNESIYLLEERKFQTTHTADSQSHSSTLCRSNSHSF